MPTAQADFLSYSPPSNRFTAASAQPSSQTLEADSAASLSRAQLAAVRVLVIDDDRTLREGCASVLQVEGYTVTACGRGDEAIEMIRRSTYDVIIIDLYMTPVPGMEILKAVMAHSPDSLAIMATGNPSVGSNLDALRAGAWDYLPKPFSGSHLQLLVGRAALAVLSRRGQAAEQAEMQRSQGNSDKLTLLGASASFRRVIELARKVSSTNASVMIVGESGTGKELIAQFVHRHSRRADRPFVAINCAAMPENLLESEMFGHRKGSFTGAEREKVGLLEGAHTGTFFLDELTEMPLALQAKLLRVVQDGVIRRVGSEQQDALVDVRFISATNRDPREAITSKNLREDLYYRLNVFPITLPPLRERVEDIAVLANHFLGQFWARHHAPRDPVPFFGDAAMDLLQSRKWRGNVRELQNLVERVVVLATPGTEISPDEIPHAESSSATPQAVVTASAQVMSDAYHVAKEQVLTQFEKEYMTRLVGRAAGNMSKAARLASVDRTTLYRLLERHGFKRDISESLT
jgi:DNA-binding NtrC family response regulator